jgi:hypothetical protein
VPIAVVLRRTMDVQHKRFANGSILDLKENIIYFEIQMGCYRVLVLLQ